MLKDRETPVLKRRLIASVGFLIVLMYFSMGHMMWNWPLPAFMDGNHVMMGLVQLYLTVIIMVINQKFFINGFKSLFGREEIDEIIPAIEAAKAEGINADGPVPPDTVFSKARGGWYDIVVAMYHDQGHIPLKVVGFVYNHEKKAWDAVAGVNITLGLPIIRVSVDHGTAFDQAGTGTASELSLRNSIEYAVMFANNKN